MPSGTTAGYVLAGGASRRMGYDKSRLPWRGLTLLEYVARQVESAAGSVAVVGGAERSGLRVIPDAFPGSGPLGGIATALADSRVDWTLITACDMPGLTSDWLRDLLARAAGEVLVPRTADGRVHPLTAVWHRTALPKVRSAVLAGTYRMREAVRALDYRWIGVEDADLVANVNTPGDWALVGE